MNCKNSTRLFLALVCAFGRGGLRTEIRRTFSSADTAADTAALATTAAGWEKAYNDKDADALAALYTEDAQLLPPGATEVSGRDAIRAYFVADIEKHWARISIKSDSSGIGGEMGLALRNLERRDNAHGDWQVHRSVAPHCGWLANAEGHLEHGCRVA